jgi:23S rRNA (cytosine1962-C5)-methyltransferase
VAQFLSAGAHRWKGVLVDALLGATGLARLYERSDTSSRSLEGLPAQAGWLRGEGPTELTIREHDWKLTLDIATGHKTGFYLDQRDSRRKFADHAAACSSSAYSIATAIRAASPWRRWLEEQAM